MNFKFKLSKRLALMKAALASVALTLACDQTDLTGPTRLLRPLTDVASPNSVALSVVAVVASANDGNIPENTIDNNLATRWSASGDGQWIRYDLGAVAAIDHVDIAWYLGDTRVSYFDIQVSLDTVTWTKVFSGQSSGQTLQLESYTFPADSGRYVRIVGHGNSTSTWNSIAEVDLYDPPTASPDTTAQSRVAQVSLTPASTTLVGGGLQQLVATLTDASGNTLTGRSVTWTTSNNAVATVSASGLVTGVAAGTATITARAKARAARPRSAS